MHSFNDEEAEDLSGTCIEQYQYLKILGRGRTSTVYLGKHTVAQKTVAIKVPTRSHLMNYHAVSRFEMEAKISCIVEHSGLQHTVDFGYTSTGWPRMMTRIATGKALSAVLADNGALSLDASLVIFQQLCHALHHCHQRGVIHARLNLDDIFIDLPILQHDSSKQCVTIIDFGDAFLIGEEAEHLRQKMIEAPYTSPEQFLPHRVDFKADIYSLGCIMYETMTGKRAVCADNLAAGDGEWGNTMFDNRFPSWLKTVIERCIAINPGLRYSSVTQILDDITPSRVSSNQP